VPWLARDPELTAFSAGRAGSAADAILRKWTESVIGE
jgi:hypothetical protein